jgi:hypothetical protein
MKERDTRDCAVTEPGPGSRDAAALVFCAAGSTRLSGSVNVKARTPAQWGHSVSAHTQGTLRESMTSPERVTTAEASAAHRHQRG